MLIPVFAVTGDCLPVSIVAVETQPASLKLIVVYCFTWCMLLGAVGGL